MSTQSQLLEGKIFIHTRVKKQLHITHSLYHPACYFECFIKSQNNAHQNYTGHFLEVHCQPNDHIRLSYIHQNNTYKIIALFNITQQILHVHPLEKHIGVWTIRYRYIPDFIQLFCFCTASLFVLFSISTYFTGDLQVIKSFFDSIKLSLLICAILLFAFIALGLPILYYKYRISDHKLNLLGLSKTQKKEIQKMRIENGIYRLKKTQFK